MYTFNTSLLLAFLGLIHLSFLTTNTTSHNSYQLSQIESLSSELTVAYSVGENIIIIDKNGKGHLNPNKADLLKLSPQLFNENRVRVSIASRSDNGLCSTEIVITGKSGRLEGNYTMNSCSSYGWIFFTPSNCFEVAIYHDAGLEAPFGKAINGSVDWTFQFNQQSRISGTYMDLGAANMYKVASPCYGLKKFSTNNAISRKRTVHRSSLGIGY